LTLIHNRLFELVWDGVREVEFVWIRGHAGDVNNERAWEQKSSTGPSARSSATMAWDETRTRVVLYGGEAGGGVLKSDTWTWKATTK
jgi:hypothetical protein